VYGKKSKIINNILCNGKKFQVSKVNILIFWELIPTNHYCVNAGYCNLNLKKKFRFRFTIFFTDTYILSPLLNKKNTFISNVYK